jgi:hypothetical protein
VLHTSTHRENFTKKLIKNVIKKIINPMECFLRYNFAVTLVIYSYNPEENILPGVPRGNTKKRWSFFPYYGV